MPQTSAVIFQEHVGAMPAKSSTMMLTVTEKQFEAMDICLGTRDGPVLDSDSTLVII